MTGPNGLPLKATYRCAEGALQKALLEGVGSYDEQLIADISQMLLDDTTKLAVRPPDRHAFIALVAAGSRAISARFADGTNRVDKSYWRKWSEYCNGVCGTPRCTLAVRRRRKHQPQPPPPHTRAQPSTRRIPALVLDRTAV